jgi:YD repeat-containing protein
LVAAVTDSLGRVAATQYDKAGRKTIETDANGHTTGFTYDEAGRLLTVTEANGDVTSYTYDKAGNKVTQKDANGHVWTYRYDALNRLVEKEDPLLRSTTYTYDALGNLKTKTDGNQKTTTYNYTVRRLGSTVYADGSSEMFTYDTFGRRQTMSSVTPSGAKTVTYTYGYDNLNRLTAMTDSRFAPRPRCNTRTTPPATVPS